MSDNSPESRERELKRHIHWLFYPRHPRRTMLYVGARPDRAQLVDMFVSAGWEITLLEIWPDNTAHYENDARFKRVVCGDVREIDTLDLGRFDAVVWWHGPEHVAESDLGPTVAKIEAICDGLVLLGAPWGEYRQEADDNPYEAHLTTLQSPAFIEMGYTAWSQGTNGAGHITAYKFMRPTATAPTHIPHVVMVTHGDRPYIEETIPALFNTTDWPFTLTVVANLPLGTNEAFLREWEPHLYGLKIYRRNVGKGRAANYGWKLRNADYSVLLDDDSLAVESDWLRKLVDIVDVAPEVGIVGHNPDDHVWPFITVGNPPRQLQVQPTNVWGGCMLVPRRTVEAIGYLNDIKYGEIDYLYSQRARLAGFKFGYFDCAVLGKSFEHLLGGYEDPEYMQWKQQQRAEMQKLRDRLMQQYQSVEIPLKEK